MNGALALPATLYDRDLFLKEIRVSDIHELDYMARALGRFSNPKMTVHAIFETCQPWAMIYKGELMGLGGVMPTQKPGFGAIWFLGTELADIKPLVMTQCCMRFLAAAQREYEWLGGYVPLHMTTRVRWLAKIGFDIKIEEAKQQGRGFALFQWPKPELGPEEALAAL